MTHSSLQSFYTDEFLPAFLEQKLEVTKSETTQDKDKLSKLVWAVGTGFGSHAGATNGNFSSLDQHTEKKKELLIKQYQVMTKLNGLLQHTSTQDAALLIPFFRDNHFSEILLRVFDEDSFLSLNLASPIVMCALELLGQSSHQDDFCSLFFEPVDGQHTSVFDSLMKLSVLADDYLKLTENCGKHEVKETTLSNYNVSYQPGLAHNKEYIPKEQQLEYNDCSKVLAETIRLVAGLLKEKADSFQPAPSTANSGVVQAEPTPSPSLSLDAQYEKALNHLRFLSVEEHGRFEERHLFANEVRKQTRLPNMRRISQEITSLRTSLPFNIGSSVFVRVDENCAQLIKAVISGPEDTPYESGLFEFDIFLNSGFPTQPPQVIITTTGNGTVRFNPNLYSDGKVCLSLLGTWSGDAGESWNPVHSTLIQVFVSIQALILVDHPFFNEPGYESSYNTDEGRKQDRSYNNNIRRQTVQWAMIDQIQKAQSGNTEFADVILAHFRVKKDIILKKVEEWKADTGIDDKAMETLRTLLEGLKE
ncbi:putative Ubiquitin-conjugating enzyme E2 Z [Blattamonas nauphoetae]|uniref:Ubiquitin-conjugating enzyme E2 Z n=1 Tax=Blattamonas nauphoetae TaxID=2049346 RepID=A0ABQ9Y677_9EUKA|nr:putative Ubiquitin-conjugating enzyme E2 Z [Blattamonas nauphoetae]